MESLAAFLVAAALLMRFVHQDRIAAILFAPACLLVALLLRLHATDLLKLNF